MKEIIILDNHIKNDAACYGFFVFGFLLMRSEILLPYHIYFANINTYHSYIHYTLYLYSYTYKWILYMYICVYKKKKDINIISD